MVWYHFMNFSFTDGKSQYYYLGNFCCYSKMRVLGQRCLPLPITFAVWSPFTFWALFLILWSPMKRSLVHLNYYSELIRLDTLIIIEMYSVSFLGRLEYARPSQDDLAIPGDLPLWIFHLRVVERRQNEFSKRTLTLFTSVWPPVFIIPWKPSSPQTLTWLSRMFKL